MKIARIGPYLLLLMSYASASVGQAQDFKTCVDGWRSKAIADGIPPNIVNQVLDAVRPIPRVLENDRSQPEFTQTFAQYYDRRVTELRVQKGREKLREHAQLLQKVQRTTGVPPHYLVALWGLETNFGTYFGNLSIPSALATLACDARRSAYFGGELIAILHIIANGDIAESQLTGSWAGAIGHMQFMPTTFLTHAVDGDGDGRRDLIGNIDDALSSGGRYLQQLGWQSGYRWGREVRLPQGFDYSLSGSDQWRPLSEWARLGVTDVSGNKLPAADLQAAVLLPTGHLGPVFLVYPNFRVIMEWNRSGFYALSVGRLADRIAGAGKLHRPFPKVADIRFTTAQIVELQKTLNQLGFDAGEPDGVVGPATRRAIRAFQVKHDLLADGYPNPTVLSRLAQQG